MSHLSPLPHYFFVPPNKKGLPRALSRSSFLETPVLSGHGLDPVVDLPAEDSAWTLLGPYQQRAYRPQRLLPHPLHSAPQRHWGLAGGHQPIVTTSGAYQPPIRRRDRFHLPEFTLRHYSTQRNVCARPSTVNRFFHLNGNNFWTDKINWLLDDIGRISRSMRRWPSIKPEQRYMLRPMIPANLPRSVSMPDIAPR